MARGPNTQTRRKILDVALKLFTTQGYDRTSLREISQNLGFSKAALYYHFQAKEDILEALAGDLIDQFDQIVRTALATNDRSVAARVAMLGDIVDLLLSNRAVADLLLSVQPPLQHTDIGERVHRLLPMVQQALMPPRPTPEQRIRASAALAIVSSTLDHLADVPVTTLRNVVLNLAISALGGEADHDEVADPVDVDDDAGDAGEAEGDDAAGQPSALAIRRPSGPGMCRTGHSPGKATVSTTRSTTA